MTTAEPKSHSGARSKRRRRAFGCATIACIAILAGAAAYTQLNLSLIDMGCATRLRYEVAPAFSIYASDHDDTYPTDKWMDAVGPYRSGERHDDGFRCPALAAVDPTAYGYAFNKTLVGKKVAKNDDSVQIPLVFESTLLGRNAVSGLETFPRKGRHRGKSFVVFADWGGRWIPDGRKP